MKYVSWRFLVLLIGYSIATISLTFFSYTQIDLSLTLSQFSVWQTIQKAFQFIGYYNRPLATAWYVISIALFFVLYGCLLFWTFKSKITKRQIFWIIGVSAGILLFSYPAALSYDIFNYIFTARSIVVYGQNPYGIIPLQLSGIDPMLSFMRWTHLPSAYTPLWIFVSLPLYFLSFHSIILNIFLIKLLMVGFYCISLWGIYSVLKTLTKKQTLPLIGIIIFGLNPLVLIEALVSSHNDMMMMGFVFFSLVLLIHKKYVASLFVFALSVATKLMSVSLFPLWVIQFRRIYGVIFMTVALLAVLLRREFLPWYFLWVLPFIALIPESISLTIIGTGISIGLLLRYAPVLYSGTYDVATDQTRSLVFILPTVISFIIVGFIFLRTKVKPALHKN